jgi:hypothetical protein
MPALAEAIGCSESTVWNYIHEMLPYLRSELPASLLEPWQQDCDSVERAQLESCLAALPAGELLVDSWEQPMPRPQDHEEQEAYYSGKQKEHTRKNQLISLPNGIDIVESTGFQGSCKTLESDADPKLSRVESYPFWILDFGFWIRIVASDRWLG